MALVFDLETVGEDLDDLPERSRDRLVQKQLEAGLEPDKARIEAAKQLNFSPFTSFIVAIGIYDTAKEQGAVYYQHPQSTKETTDAPFRFVPMTEKEMLVKFWEIAQRYDQFVTFNGRGFDLPFLYIRSALHGQRPTKDLNRGRYLYQQSVDAKHYDLQDQLSFYGASRGVSLDLACRAFKIDSPKLDDLDGSQISKAFSEGRYLEIARYNSRDLLATAKLFAIWQKFLA